ELGERADLEVFHHHVGAGGELLDDAPPLFAVEIKLDRPLAAIGAVEIGGVEVTAVGAGHERRPPGPGVVADALAFDLDHVGTEIGEELLSGRGEASGVALANEILDEYADLTIGPRIAFFEAMATTFGHDRARIDEAVAAWRADPSAKAAAALHRAAEPRRLELLRRLNLAPGGTAALVRMREQLLDAMNRRGDLKVVDNDFVHMFSSWFNRG